MRHLGTLQNTSEMAVQQRTTDTRMNLVIELDIMECSSAMLCVFVLCTFFSLTGLTSFKDFEL